MAKNKDFHSGTGQSNKHGASFCKMLRQEVKSTVRAMHTQNETRQGHALSTKVVRATSKSGFSSLSNYSSLMA